jgi:hypothetical protein
MGKKLFYDLILFKGGTSSASPAIRSPFREGIVKSTTEPVEMQQNKDGEEVAQSGSAHTKAAGKAEVKHKGKEDETEKEAEKDTEDNAEKHGIEKTAEKSGTEKTGTKVKEGDKRQTGKEDKPPATGEKMPMDEANASEHKEMGNKPAPPPVPAAEGHAKTHMSSHGIRAETSKHKPVVMAPVASSTKKGKIIKCKYSN